MTNTTLRGWMNSMSVKTTVRTFKTMKIIAELMETLQVINPRLYAGVIKKAKGITKRGQHRFGVALFFISFGKPLCILLLFFCPHLRRTRFLLILQKFLLFFEIRFFSKILRGKILHQFLCLFLYDF